MAFLFFAFLSFGAIQVGLIPLANWNFMDFVIELIFAICSFRAEKEIKEMFKP